MRLMVFDEVNSLMGLGSLGDGGLMLIGGFVEDESLDVSWVGGPLGVF